MSDFANLPAEAWHLLRSGDPDTWKAILTSLHVSLVATALGTLIGVPAGLAIGSRSFRGKSALTVFLHTLLSVPTVVVGLILYLLFTRSGLMGDFDLLFTPTLMVIAETLLILPMIIVFTATSVAPLATEVLETSASLGAGRWRAGWTLLDEARLGVFAAIVAGFGRAISEVGAALMLGGNIRGYTRTMTTSIALETSKGEFGLGLALALILMLIAFSINLVIYSLQRQTRTI
ncbi:MAG: ABC transporter permease [Planctomycetota bacterium]|nr:ABC transporter permease [Planctomycetota bacterium]MDA1142162.1 ABC transporter permease [Planctomycetota bacterium]